MTYIDWQPEGSDKLKSDVPLRGLKPSNGYPPHPEQSKSLLQPPSPAEPGPSPLRAPSATPCTAKPCRHSSFLGAAALAILCLEFFPETLNAWLPLVNLKPLIQCHLLLKLFMTDMCVCVRVCTVPYFTF